MSYEIRRAIYGKMAGDTTLTNMLGTPAAGRGQAIYHEIAPEGADDFPYVIFFKSAGTPTYSMASPGSAYDSDVWTIKGVDRSDSATLAEGIASRLDELLTDADLSVSGGTVMWLARESDLEYSELAGGVAYKHAGALFRLIHA